jgi:hypothetical protein
MSNDCSLQHKLIQDGLNVVIAIDPLGYDELPWLLNKNKIFKRVYDVIQRISSRNHSSECRAFLPAQALHCMDCTETT